jgi:signal transduction histidine kinase
MTGDHLDIAAARGAIERAEAALRAALPRSLKSRDAHATAIRDPAPAYIAAAPGGVHRRPGEDRRRRTASALPDQRCPRPLQDRGGADGAAADHRQRPHLRVRAGDAAGIILGQAIDRAGVIRGDERKVKQMLLNLLSDATRSTPEGSRCGWPSSPRSRSEEFRRAVEAGSW